LSLIFLCLDHIPKQFRVQITPTSKIARTKPNNGATVHPMMSSPCKAVIANDYVSRNCRAEYASNHGLRHRNGDSELREPMTAKTPPICAAKDAEGFNPTMFSATLRVVPLLNPSIPRIVAIPKIMEISKCSTWALRLFRL
jgi:hypothetical protein